MKDTKIIKVSAQEPDPGSIAEAGEVLRRGGLVAFPTETVYGLGADAFNADAVNRVFAAKGRPADNPLIVHIARIEHFAQLARTISLKARILAEKFWPGPLTLVVEGRGEVPDIVTARLKTIALRMPDHQVALELIGRFGGGIVGPSANLSGRPSPTASAHVEADLRGKIDMILDCGPTAIGIESTVIDVSIDPPIILRLGGLIEQDIENAIGEVHTTSEAAFLKRSPGTRHRHYAPRAKLILVEQGNTLAFVQLIESCQRGGTKAGSIVHSGRMKKIGSKTRMVAASEDVEEYSRTFFAHLRELDQAGVDVIIVEAVPDEGIGAAVMERLRRAADDHDPCRTISITADQTIQ